MSPNGRRVLAARVLVAAVQAAALYFLTGAARAPATWPATVPALFVPLMLVFCLIPVLVLLGIGYVRARALALWTLIALAVVAGLGCHDALRGRLPDWPGAENFWPSLRLWLALTGSLFVAHVLVVDSIIERRVLVSYPRHFDTAWKFAVQCALAVAFVGVFWSVLELGAGLFKLVDIDFFSRLIHKRWFVFPAITVAVAVAIHVTDVQPALIRGTRSLVLTLFSWLLPLLAAILLGFLAGLPFISLATLWNTHFATSLLLTSAALLVVLINSCYQDGEAEQTRSRVKRVAVRVGAIELIPLVALAAWALALRIQQHGWTVERVLAAAAIAMVACYAIGYTAAALRSPTWMKRVEITNLVSAYVFVAIVLALFSPISDPARLMVSDQLARLKSGAVSADQFDYRALKFDGARWGAAALRQLAQTTQGAEAATIADKAREALALTNRFAWRRAAAPPTASDMAQRIAVYPAGRSLPTRFLDDAFAVPDEPYCQTGNNRCVARFVQLAHDQPEAIFFLDSRFSGYLFEQDAGGRWVRIGRLNGNFHCLSGREQFGDAAIGLQPHKWPDLVFGGARIEIESYAPACGSP